MKNTKNNSIDNLYKKSANETTPTALDNLILNQAKQSCETQIAKTKPRRWIYSLATAAVFVMGFSMIINLQNVNQEMQTAPQPIGLEKSVEVEFLPDADAPLEPHNTNRLKKQKAPTKLKLSKPKPIELNELKNDARKAEKDTIKQESIAGSLILEAKEAPVLTIPAPVYKDIPVAGITDGDLGLARGNTLGSTIKEQEESVMSDSIEAAPTIVSEQRQEDYYDPQDDIELDKVVVTGSRIRRADLEEEISITEDIQKLEGLITHKRFTRAKRLLKKLKKKYPDYDFSELELLIKKSS